jgi:hypothetical protein
MMGVCPSTAYTLGEAPGRFGHAPAPLVYWILPEAWRMGWMRIGRNAVRFRSTQLKDTLVRIRKTYAWMHSAPDKQDGTGAGLRGVVKGFRIGNMIEVLPKLRNISQTVAEIYVNIERR